MSTIPLASPSSTSTLDPRLTEIIPDYAAVRDGKINERYQSIPASMQNYALALSAKGKDGWANRLAGCCKSGSESAVCDRNKFAKAHRHHCSDPFCQWDSSGRYRFNKWARTRDPETFKLPHTAFELKMSGACNCDAWIDQQMHTTAVLGGIAWAMMRGGEQAHVSVDAFAENVANTAVRVVFQGSMTYTQLQYWAEKRATAYSGKHSPDCPCRPQVTIKRGETLELFHWAFNGFKECATMSAERKAELRVAIGNTRSVVAWGDIYKPLPKERLREIAEERSAKPCLCPVCKDHELTVIAPQDRHARPIEEIESQYEHVDWSSDYDPFVNGKGALTVNSPKKYGEFLTAETLGDSSPPW